MNSVRKHAAALSWTLACAAFLGALSATADVRLASIFSDHMVLQREKPVPVWGWADAGEEVAVAFAGQTVATHADAEGRWSVTLQPLPASCEGAELTVTGKNTLTLHDVLVGEVWLGAGQSNMEFVLRRCVKEDPEKLAATANYPLIRHFRVTPGILPLACAEVEPFHEGGWAVPSPTESREFYALLYYFAVELYETLGVPIGVIGSAVGGTKIEPFISFEGVYSDPHLAELADHVRAQKIDPHTPDGKARFEEWVESVSEWAKRANRYMASSRPTYEYPPANFIGKDDVAARYHAMIAPLTRFPIRGILWYQGCNNSSSSNYTELMRALICDWRRAWGEELPFYWVQLPNIGEVNRQPAGGDGWAAIRMRQFRALDVPHTGMAVGIDIGDPKDLHPCNKYDVAKRLALWTFAKDYGFKDVVCSGPLYRGMTLEGASIRLAFDHVASGLMVGDKLTNRLEPAFEVTDAPLGWFAIAGEDRVWHWAEATIDGDTVVVSSPDVPAPVAVRYAYTGNPEGPKLYNREGLPASPFRTDDW